jgi:lipopolysaccharide/colanic/teichoic acid biosynthesis glycosyltransferase
MTAVLPAVAVQPRTATPTIFGCTPRQTHDRFWAAFGVQVVRRRTPSEIVAGAELFLLLEPDEFVLFRPAQVLDSLYWLKPRLLLLRVKDARPRPYRELVVTQDDRLVRFERVYRDARARATRVALTPDLEVARLWQNSDDVSPWRRLLRHVGEERLVVRPAVARVYDETDDAQVMECVRDVLRCWDRPDTTIGRAARIAPRVWADETARVGAGVAFDGPVWIGAGRAIDDRAYIVGPAVLWDEPSARPAADEVKWLELEPTALTIGGRPAPRGRRIAGQRGFDVAFASAALAATAPLYPLVALAIFLEDGGPIFFAHRRETVGGREFPCLKFRSMRKGADLAKAELARKNQCDGPQFFMKDDPRVTRVGRLLRKLQIDELPQFLNVLLGHMSIVGPRPSPYRENQFCPAWREARLSVRPGITGLWQVSRTRKSGLDFQEWIRFDLEYVEKAGWGMDLKIVWRTLRVIVEGVRR